jgi:hypothetical protein
MDLNKPVGTVSAARLRALAGEWRERAQETYEPLLLTLMLRTAEQLELVAAGLDDAQRSKIQS